MVQEVFCTYYTFLQTIWKSSPGCFRFRRTNTVYNIQNLIRNTGTELEPKMYFTIIKFAYTCYFCDQL